MSSIRVVVADDDEVLRRTMAEVLAAHDGLVVVADLADASDLAAEVARTGADLVVLDVRMPSGGPAAARAVRALPRPPVVVAVSASTDAATVTGMVRAGVTGFLAKGNLGTTFVEDLLRCARGEVVLAVANAGHVLRGLTETSGT